MIKSGDFVRGSEGSPYGFTNHKMTRGLVMRVFDEHIYVRILEHEDGETGIFPVQAKYFEVIGHVKSCDDPAELRRILEGGQIQASLEFDLSGANLSEANLRGANLRGTDLSGDNLREANLSGSDLSWTDLRGTDLSGTDLSWTDLNGTDLNGANLRGANLREANLSEADLSEADLSGANLRGADLSGTDLSGANLRGANLREANLSGSDLSGANLSGADLDFSCWGFSCKTLHIGAVDVRLARQLAFHFAALPCDDPEFIVSRNAVLGFANKFHRKDVKRLSPRELPEAVKSDTRDTLNGENSGEMAGE